MPDARMVGLLGRDNNFNNLDQYQSYFHEHVHFIV
jgi:hypothetical protein